MRRRSLLGMINDQISLEQLRDVIALELPMAYELYVKAVAGKDTAGENWARGRVNGLLQTLRRIDKDKHAELDELWQKAVMTAKGRTGE